MRLPHLLAGPWVTMCLVAAVSTGPARAAPAHYVLDPVHTRVMFAVDHAGFSKAIGTVSGSTGTLRFDPDDWRLAAVDVEVPVSRIDLGDEAWNRATLARSLLDAEQHPVARFVSSHVEPVDARSARVHGQLTLRGVTRAAVLDVVLNAIRRHPMPPFRRTVGFSATAILSRSDFGIDAWRSMIGDTVELRLEVEATRSRSNGDGRADAGAPPDGEDAIDSFPGADSSPPGAGPPPTEPDVLPAEPRR